MCYFIVCLQWIMYWVLFGWLLGDFMGDRQGLSFSVKWLYFFVVYILVALVPSKKRGGWGCVGARNMYRIFLKDIFQNDYWKKIKSKLKLTNEIKIVCQNSFCWQKKSTWKPWYHLNWGALYWPKNKMA